MSAVIILICYINIIIIIRARYPPRPITTIIIEGCSDERERWKYSVQLNIFQKLRPQCPPQCAELVAYIYIIMLPNNFILLN